MGEGGGAWALTGDTIGGAGAERGRPIEDMEECVLVEGAGDGDRRR